MASELRGPIVVMGVSGSGKTTVGTELARRLGVPFVDADDLHPAANRAKMVADTPLDDDDRWPWLQGVAGWLTEHPDGGVTACSALKRSYRDVLRGGRGDVRFLLLHGDHDLLEKRLEDRSGHFMPASLLDSQLATLESFDDDEHGIVVDVALGVDEVVAHAIAALKAEQLS